VSQAANSGRRAAAEEDDKAAEDAQRPQAAPQQAERRVRKPAARNTPSRPRGRQVKSSRGHTSDVSEIELMASQSESSTPAASPASTSKITKLRERKAPLLKEKEDRAKGSKP